jgi:hypothetical protein
MKLAAQPNLFQHSDQAKAQAFRIAADTARRDPFWSPEEGERRAQAYEAQAREWDAREAGA